MFAESLASFNHARDQYAAASAGSVADRSSAELGDIASSFGSFGSMCDAVRRNARTRAERVKRNGAEVEARRRRLEAICGHYGIRPPARRPGRPGTFRPSSAAGAGGGTGSGPASGRPLSSGGVPPRRPPTPTTPSPRMTQEDQKAAEEFAAAFAAMNDIRTELEKADKTLATVQRVQTNLRDYLTVSTRFKTAAGHPSPDMGRMQACRRSSEALANEYGTLAGECGNVLGSLGADEVDGLGRDLREIRHEIENLRRSCPGTSRMANDVMARVASVLSSLENTGRRVTPLKDRLGRLAGQCADGQRQWNSQSQSLAGQIAAEQDRSRSMSQDLSRISALVTAISEDLARLSGKPKTEFAGTARIGGLSMPELRKVPEIPAIVERSKKAHRERLLELGKAFRRSQKQPDELAESDLNKTHAMPRHVVCGDVTTTALGGGTLPIPVASEFPFQSPIRFADAADIPSFLLRLLYAMPVGAVKITAVDCSRHGEAVLPLNELGRDAGILHTVANANDLAPAMDGIVEEMGAMARDRFSATVQNWAQYNAANSGAPLPLHVLAVFSLGTLDTYSRTLAGLANILETGTKFGILCLVAKSALDALDDRQRSALANVRMADIPLTLAGSGLPPCPNLALAPGGMRKASDAFVGARVSDYAKALAKRNERPVRSFMDLFEGIDFWQGDATEGVSATIGWDVAGSPVLFELGVGRGQAAVHALVGGTTGSGKSVFLHTLIQSLAGKYSPEELQFFLLDYKNGDEFKKYADDRGDAWLPHVRMIARHRDPRFALELFDFLDKEIRRRSDLFGNYGDIVAYRKNGGKCPRILIVIDEFQIMFESYCGQDLSENIAKRLATVFKQGRAYGVHVILATQSLKSMTFRGMGGILSQVAMRIALYGQKEDGILADSNDAATRLVPKRQCIVNPAFGAKDTEGTANNLVADVPFSDPAQVDGCKKFRALVVRTARDRRLKPSCRVFNGAVLPDPPPSEMVNEALKPEKWNVLFPVLLGARTDFSSTPFTVSFTANPREHMLVAGEDGKLVEGGEVRISGEDIWKGIRHGLVRSFRPLRSCEVLWYDPTVPDVPPGLPDWFIAVGGRATGDELLAAFRELARAKAERKIVVVENFQDAALLHPGDAPRPTYGSKPAEPPPETARSVFAAAFNGLEAPPFHAILMTRNFGYLHRRVFARSGAEANLLDACGKRVAFNLAPEVQDIVVPGLSLDAKRGPRRVWFGDVNTGKNTDFLPYSRAF